MLDKFSMVWSTVNSHLWILSCFSWHLLNFFFHKLGSPLSIMPVIQEKRSFEWGFSFGKTNDILLSKVCVWMIYWYVKLFQFCLDDNICFKSKQLCVATVRLAPEDEAYRLTGFSHNAVTPVGMKTQLPVSLKFNSLFSGVLVEVMYWKNAKNTPLVSIKITANNG